jgi:streptogramin lyase
MRTPALYALGIALLAGCTSSAARHPGGSAISGRPTPVPTGSKIVGQPWVVQRIHTGSDPCATLGEAGSVWVADIVDNVVKRLDPKTGRTTAHYRTASGPCGMAYGAGSVWVEDYNGNAVTRIDVATGKLHNYPVGTSPYDVAFTDGAAWVTNYNDSTVSRVDARTGKTTTIKVGAQPQGIAPAAGALWVADSGASAITRIDATTRKTTTVQFNGFPAWTAFDADTVWIGDQSNGEIVELDAHTSKIVRRSKVGTTPNDGDVADGAVWFPDKDGSLYRLDEQTHQVTGPFTLRAGNPFVLDGYDGKLWIADYGGTDTIVVDPSRLPSS